MNRLVTTKTGKDRFGTCHAKFKDTCRASLDRIVATLSKSCLSDSLMNAPYFWDSPHTSEHAPGDAVSSRSVMLQFKVLSCLWVEVEPLLNELPAPGDI